MGLADQNVPLLCNITNPYWISQSRYLKHLNFDCTIEAFFANLTTCYPLSSFEPSVNSMQGCVIFVYMHLHIQIRRLSHQGVKFDKSNLKGLGRVPLTGCPLSTPDWSNPEYRKQWSFSTPLDGLQSQPIKSSLVHSHVCPYFCMCT